MANDLTNNAPKDALGEAFVGAVNPADATIHALEGGTLTSITNSPTSAQAIRLVTEQKDGGSPTIGTTGDALYSGSGSASLVAIQKGLYALLNGLGLINVAGAMADGTQKTLRTAIDGSLYTTSHQSMPTVISGFTNCFMSLDWSQSSLPGDFATSAATSYPSFIWPAHRYERTWISLMSQTAGDATTPFQVLYTYEDYLSYGDVGVYWHLVNLPAPTSESLMLNGSPVTRYVWRWSEADLNNFSDVAMSRRITGIKFIFKEGAGTGGIRGGFGWRWGIGH